MRAEFSISSVEFERAGAVVNRPLPAFSTKYFRLLINGVGLDEKSKVTINGIRVNTISALENQVRVNLPAGRVGAVDSNQVIVEDAAGRISNKLSY